MPRNKEQKWANSHSVEIKRGRGDGGARLKGEEGVGGEAKEEDRAAPAMVLKIFAD